MIDIHHHLLFGLDDGSPDLETSVAMVEAAAADGITHIVCTPHANSRFEFRPEVNQEKLEALRARVNGKVTLGLGCDFHLSFDNIEDALRHPFKYSINQKSYLLVEFDDLMIPANIRESFYELGVAGLTPIITHPERNYTLQRAPERLKDWLQEGCLIQVTAASLTGRFGKTAQAIAHQLFARNWVHFLATDAHNTQSRPPLMKEAYELVAKRYGSETAERLCVQNPRAAYFGEPLPPQPEAVGVFEADELPPRPKKGLLGRLFSGS